MLYRLSFISSCAEWIIRRTVSPAIRSGPVLQLLPTRMTCPGRWGRVRWFASKSSVVCRSLFCLEASSSWPALAASLLSCGSGVRTRSDVFSEAWCWEGTDLSSLLRLKYVLCPTTLLWRCAEGFWSRSCPSVFPLFWLQPKSQPHIKQWGLWCCCTDAFLLVWRRNCYSKSCWV